MNNISLLPDDVKLIIAGYYGEKLQAKIQNDIIDYYIKIRILLNNINHQQIRYKLFFWKIIKTVYCTNKKKEKSSSNIPQIGFIWGIMNEKERYNFIRHIL
jgi:hypothetical protein